MVSTQHSFTRARRYRVVKAVRRTANLCLLVCGIVEAHGQQIVDDRAGLILFVVDDLREIRLHDLRHTCASVLIQNRVPLIEVQQWLGHSTLETTADLYAHLEYETKLASAETLKKI